MGSRFVEVFPCTVDSDGETRKQSLPPSHRINDADILQIPRPLACVSGLSADAKNRKLAQVPQIPGVPNRAPGDFRGHPRMAQASQGPCMGERDANVMTSGSRTA